MNRIELISIKIITEFDLWCDDDCEEEEEDDDDISTLSNIKPTNYHEKDEFSNLKKKSDLLAFVTIPQKYNWRFWMKILY